MPDSLNYADLLHYWRDTLAYAQMADVAPHSKNGCEIDPEALRTGHISQNKMHALLAGKARGRKRQEGTERHGAATTPETLSVVITALPVRALQKGRAAPGRQEVAALLCIPARLTAEGTLLPDEDSFPWIPRKYLAPTPQLSVGELEDYDRFMTKNPVLTTQDWGGLWMYACDLFSSVSGQAVGTISLDGYERLKPWIQLVDTNAQNATRAILEGYDDLLRQLPTTPPLLKRLISGTTPQIAENQSWRKSTAHSGQMRRDFGLAESQRQALDCALRLGEGELLAVNGPPGTGKTTLLQSIIASLWVQSVLQAEGAMDAVPTVILGCSTNNQAVTNILDSFARSDSDPDGNILFRRWLPAPVNSYGLAFPSQSTLGKDGFVDSYAHAIKAGKSWDGLPRDIESRDFVGSAEQHYLHHARHYLQQVPGSIEEVVRILHARIKELHNYLTYLVQCTLQAETALSAAGFPVYPQDYHSAKTQDGDLLIQEQQERDVLKTRLTQKTTRLKDEQAQQAFATAAYDAKGMREHLFFWSSAVKEERLQRACAAYPDGPDVAAWSDLQAYWKGKLKTLRASVLHARKNLKQTEEHHHDRAEGRRAALAALSLWQENVGRFSSSPSLDQSHDILDQALDGVVTRWQPKGRGI